MMLVIGKQVISPVKYTEREKRELKTVIAMLRSKALRQTFKHMQISVYTHANDSLCACFVLLRSPQTFNTTPHAK